MAFNLQSLITILQQTLNSKQGQWFFHFYNKPQLKSLLQKASSLQEVLDNTSLPLMKSLEIQIREAAHKAEDIIESHMVQFSYIAQDLHQVTQELDSIMEQAMKLVKVEEKKKMSTGSSSWSGASLSISKNIVVGVDADLMHLKDRLIGMEKKLEIIPIVGMGGIGKTTLARKLYEDPYIIYHFQYVRAWTTVSQDYNMRAILLSLLRCIIGKEHSEKGNDELKDILYRSLYGRRYMIILDDIWGKNFWDEMRMYFPDNNNRSRIVITTRESDVAKYVDSKSQQHEVQFLSKYESWNLFHQIVFGDEDCPHVLKEIGEKIVKDCGGLPLAIHVIGGLLSRVKKSKAVWEKIGNDVRAAIAKSDEQYSNIFSLSYDHLPNHLKPCFLYMGAFPEDYEIKGSKFVQMWVAEGFVKSNGKKSLEEEAEDWLKSLVERNLVLVRYNKYGKPKSYSMHDLLRDLCIRKSDEEKFLHVKNGRKLTFSNPRRVSVHASYGMTDLNALAKSIPHARSFIGIGFDRLEIPFGAFSALRLLRVLVLLDLRFSYFSTEIFDLVHLRCLVVRSYRSIPSGISRLLNLQTLIVRSCGEPCGFDEPSELWQLSELTYLKVNGVILSEDADLKYSVMKNVQMISSLIITHSANWKVFFKCIPNIKELGITDGTKTSMDIDLSHLHKLEILRCKSSTYSERSEYLPKVRFPGNIRKLILDRCVIHPRVLTTLCELHKLEVLKICNCKFESEVKDGDQEWEAADGDVFPSLQFLSLQVLSLVRWRADETNFPRLRHLCVGYCRRLEEIPSGIGEIPTLQHIEMIAFPENTSLVASAKTMEELQQSEYDNYDLKLSITYYNP